MSLFVGNVSKKVTQREFEDAFKNYGPCRVDLRVKFAFVQYENERNAEEAKKNLQNRNFSGLRLNIEWSKNSGRFNQNSKLGHGRSGRRSRSRDRSWRRDDKWFRRSPSYERRSTPNYSDNDDFQEFEPRCPRDTELIKRLNEKKQKKLLQKIERQKQAELDGEILPEVEAMMPEQ